MIRSLFRFNKKTFCSYGFKYPDIIIEELKSTLNNKDKASLIENEKDITNNIHFFDSDQFTDIVTLLGINKRGSHELWDLLQRKAYDYELNFIQVRDLYNACLESERAHVDIEVKLLKEMARTAGVSPSSERITYNLFI